MVLLALTLAFDASAGNTDSYLLSNSAALTGGAVAATTRDGGAVWYNPAGLGGTKRNLLDLSGSAFVLRFRDMPGALQTILPNSTHTQDLSSNDFLSVPTSLVFIRHLSDSVTGGLGIYVPEQDDFKIEETLAVPNFSPDSGRTVNYEQRILIESKIVETDIVTAVGWQVAPTFRLGFGLNVIYAAANAFSQGLIHVSDSTDVPEGVSLQSQVLEASAHAKALGGQATLALQWEFAPTWHLGLIARSPSLHFTTWGEASGFDIFAAVPPDKQESELAAFFNVLDLKDNGVRVVRPARFNLALGKTFGKAYVAVEGDIQLALDDDEDDIHRKLTWNVRAGGKVHISDRLVLGGGVFTDNSAEHEPEELSDRRIDYYGASLGVELRHPHTVRGREDQLPLIFATTIAVRYALGVGQFGGLRLNLSGEEDEETGTNFVNDAIFHEVGLHIGSAIYF